MFKTTSRAGFEKCLSSLGAPTLLNPNMVASSSYRICTREHICSLTVQRSGCRVVVGLASAPLNSGNTHRGVLGHQEEKLQLSLPQAAQHEPPQLQQRHDARLAEAGQQPVHCAQQVSHHHLPAVHLSCDTQISTLRRVRKKQNCESDVKNHVEN